VAAIFVDAPVRVNLYNNFEGKSDTLNLLVIGFAMLYFYHQIRKISCKQVGNYSELNNTVNEIQ
jgi:hypothetical protein